MTDYEDIGVIIETLVCCKCGAPTVVGALGWAAMPIVDGYVGPCCRTYKDEQKIAEPSRDAR